MAAQKQGDQLERTFSSYVRIQDVVLKTYLGRWTIGRSGERGSGMSVLPARYDDDDIYIYIYIYIVIHRQACFVLSELFSVARQARFLKLGSKPAWLKRQSKILPLSHEGTSVSEGNLNAYVSHLFLFTYIRLTGTESSNSFEEPCFTLVATITSFAREFNPTGVGEHIYCHPQTDLFRSIRTLQCS